MSGTGKTVSALLLGVSVGAVLGYFLSTDKEDRQDGLARLKDKISSLKGRAQQEAHDLETEIYNA